MKKALLTFTLLLVLGNGQESIAQVGMLPDSVETFSRTVSGVYSSDHRTKIFTYDQDGNVIQTIDKDEAGRLTRKTVYVYQNGRVAETHSFDRVGIQGWVLERKEFVSYDQDGTDTTAFYYFYNSPTDSVLQEAWRTSKEYDGSGRVITSTYFVNDQQVWYPFERVHFVYRGSDTLPYEGIAEAFDFDSVAWIRIAKITQMKWDLGFEPNYREIQPSVCIVERWENGSWVWSSYDSMRIENGKIVEEYRSSYNDTTGLYELYFTIQNTYDGKGNRVIGLEMDYGGPFGIDTSVFKLDTFEYGSSDELRRHSYFEVNASRLHPFGYNEVYYFGASALLMPGVEPITIYPNPIIAGQDARMELPEQIQTLSLYNSKGQEIRSCDRLTENTLSTTGLSPGIYYVNATGALSHYVGRLVVQ